MGLEQTTCPAPASRLCAQPPAYADHMQEGCVSVRGTGPHPTLISVDMLMGFCPGGGGVRTASWSPGRGMGTGAHLESSPLQRAGWEPRPPPQPHLFLEKLRCGGVGLVGPPSVQHFQLNCTSAGGVRGRDAPTSEPKWQSIGQHAGPDPSHIFALLGCQEMEHFGHLC